MDTSVISSPKVFDPYRIHDEAILDEVIHPGLEWWVKYQGTLWRARLLETHSMLRVGSIVYVVERRGSILLIRPIYT